MKAITNTKKKKIKKYYAEILEIKRQGPENLSVYQILLEKHNTH